MTDDSEIVLRWENKTVRKSDRKYEGVFNEGGFRWTTLIEQSSRRFERVPIILQCDMDHNGPWKCNADIYVRVGTSGGVTHWIDRGHACFSDKKRTWTSRTDQYCHILAGACIEFKINVKSSERGKPIADPGKFGAPNNRSNVILKIEDEKLHVSKEFLAVHSPVFDTLFFGDFSEKHKDEVEIKDVVYEEFLDLLHVIYPGTVEITDLSVVHILKLADRFQMEEDCLQSFTSSNDLVEKIKSFPEYDKFSGDMKIAICDRIAEL